MATSILTPASAYDQQASRPILFDAGDTDELGIFLAEPLVVPTHLVIGRRVSDDRLATLGQKRGYTLDELGYTLDELVAFRDAQR